MKADRMEDYFVATDQQLLREASALIVEMREALMPFAHARANSGSSLTVADFDRARAAISKAEGQS